MKKILFDLTESELNQFVLDMGLPRFRATQIREWLNRGAPDFSVMKNLPDDLRQNLDKIAQTLPVKIVKRLDSGDNQTTKFLLELFDGQQIECVLMRTTYGNSVCVSSRQDAPWAVNFVPAPCWA